MAGLALLLVVLVVVFQPKPVDATITNLDPDPFSTGWIATVEYEGEDGRTSSDTLVLADRIEIGTSISIWPSVDSNPPMTAGDPLRLTPINMGIAAALGFLLGLVVDLSSRGFGYVRGTGQVAETPDLDVGEERGFYWRS